MSNTADIPDDEIGRNLRERVLEVLELISNKQAQLEYQAIAPDIDVAGEIFNQWEDYYRPDSALFASAFSSVELAHLQEFNAVFEKVCAETPLILPPIKDFVKSPTWQHYSEAARLALSAFPNRASPGPPRRPPR